MSEARTYHEELVEKKPLTKREELISNVLQKLDEVFSDGDSRSRYYFKLNDRIKAINQDKVEWGTVGPYSSQRFLGPEEQLEKLKAKYPDGKITNTEDLKEERRLLELIKEREKLKAHRERCARIF